MVRPKQEIKKEKRITLRLTKSDHKTIKGKAEEAGLRISEYMRQCAMDTEIYARITREELEVLQNLIEYRNHFGRIGNLIRAKDWTGTVRMTDYLANEINKIIRLFKIKGTRKQ